MDHPQGDFSLAIARYCRMRLPRAFSREEAGRLQDYLTRAWSRAEAPARRGRGYDWVSLAREAGVAHARILAGRNVIVPLLAAHERALLERPAGAPLPPHDPSRRLAAPTQRQSPRSIRQRGAFADALDSQMRRHGDSSWTLHAAITQPADRFDKSTLRTWRRGDKQPQSVESIALLNRIEQRYDLPEGYFRDRLGTRPRASSGKTPELSATESRRLAWHLPDDFPDRSASERAEILEWVRRVIIGGNTDYRLYHRESTKHRFGMRFEPELKRQELAAPPGLTEEMRDLCAFKTSTLTRAGFQRSGVWNDETAAQRSEHFGLLFGALAAATDGPVRGLEIPTTDLSFAMLVFPAVWDWYVQWRERRRGFYTSWEAEMLLMGAAFTRAGTGWLRQRPDLTDRLKPIAGLIDQAEVDAARADWDAACERLHRHAVTRAKEIERVAKVHRDPFEPILPILEADSPLAEYRKITEEILRRMPDPRRHPKPHAEAVRAFLMLRIGLHSGLRQKNLRQILACRRDEQPFTERQLTDARRGELRWNAREQGWELFIPSIAFKNASSSFFGNRPFRLVLPDLGDLYAYIDYYLERGRALLLCGSRDPRTLFVKTVKTTSRDASYTKSGFYEAWRLIIQRYGIYNPHTGLGAIKGLLPHGPHNIRDVLATHVLKQTGSYEQASYAIQDTPEMVSQHYGRFLPQDKAALAAQVLNKAWS